MKVRLLPILLVWFGLTISPVLAADTAEKAAAGAAQAWLGQIDAGNYGKSWKDAASYFQGAITEKGWNDALTGARKPLGPLVSRKLSSAPSSRSIGTRSREVACAVASESNCRKSCVKRI